MTVPARSVPSRVSSRRMPLGALAALNDFQVMLYRLFGVHATIRLAAVGENNPWDMGRPWLCDHIRRRPGMLARCDASEAGLCARCGMRPVSGECHAGFGQFALPVRCRGRLTGHVVLSPVRFTSAPAGIVGRIVKSVDPLWFDRELVVTATRKIPLLTASRTRAIVGLARAFFDPFLDWYRGGMPGGFMYYHTAVRAPDDTDAWVSFLWIGYEARTNEPRYGGWFRHRSHDLLVYAEREPCTVVLPGRRLELRKGQLVVLPAGQRYRVDLQSPQESSWPFWLHVVSSVDLSGVGRKVLTARFPVLPILRTLARMSLDDPEVYFGTPCKLRALELLLELRRMGYDAQSGRGRPPHPALLDAVDRARKHLEEHLDRHVSLDELSRIAGVNVFTLCRRFRDVVGLPPLAYHRNLRVQFAGRLLEDKRIPVKTVAYRVGFTSPRHFSRVFKEQTGMAPRALRRRRGK